MPVIGTISSRTFTGQGVVQPTPPVANSFVGTAVIIGVDATSYNANLIPQFSQNNITTPVGAYSKPSTFVGVTVNNWYSKSMFETSGTTVMLVHKYAGYVATTTDGITWTSKTRLSPNSTGPDWSNLAYGNGTWVVIRGTNAASNVVTYSTDDGNTWTNTTVPVSDYWAYIAFGGGRFLITTTSYPQNVATSTNGQTWTLVSPAPFQPASNILYADSLGTFWIIDGTGTDIITSVSTVNGNTWDGLIDSSAPGINPGGLRYVAWGNGRFVLINQYVNRSWTSYDGINWTVNLTPFSATRINWTGLRYVNGRFIATSATLGGSYTGAIYISADGISWTISTSGSTAINNGGTSGITGISTSVTVPASTPGNLVVQYYSTGLYNIISSSRLTSYQSSARSKFGINSLNMTSVQGFSGRANAVNIPLQSNLVAPFTLEAWVYCGIANSNPIFANITPFSLYGGSALDPATQNVTNASNILVRVLAGNTTTTSLNLQWDDNSTITTNDTGQTPLSTGSWIHVAVQANSSTSFSVWTDGVRRITYSSATAFGQLTNLVINPFGSGDTNFYTDEIRISNVARYANNSTITVPTQAFTVDTNTLALINFE